nr:MAG TPA: Cytosine specific methyltransferase [Caudoviricetes sp.]
MGGFPCQPFSVAGLMQGVNDTRGRGTMLSHIVRILNVKKPKYILLENVKGFLSEKFKDTREALAEMLKEIGYSTFEDASFVCTLLNTKDYGIPQNRERVWIFASLEKLPNDFGLIPYPTIASGKVCNFLDPVETIDESNFLSVEQVNKLKERLGISSFKVTEPLCLDVYNKKIKTDGTCPTLTDPSHCNIRVLECRRGEEEVRKLTISEQFRLMGFRDGEVDFANLSYSQLGKRMGNGWDVNVVTLILENIFKQLNIVK